ncbi:unnamed protein product [Macrosiphum euphorbiae]|uniref:HTH psq-type domain-containing protein n=1 Tax=Macrosiphum euphorbiae TaxID=13131 RepID=A0AAV0XRG4_9HEMI|nr:unnamed protein product [Macrosiphum euphorbiae]
MVSHYARISERQRWSEESMKKAIIAVQNKEMGWLKASKQFNVPQATLRRRFHNTNKIAKGIVKHLGRPSCLSSMVEKKLVDHILNLESRFFGMTVKEVKKLAYDFAEEAHIPHNFNKEKREAGWDWLAGFRKRNPELSLRSPEPTSAARAQAFNKPQVHKFFNIFFDTMRSENISVDKIYNMDESALTTVQKPSKIFAQKGKKQVGVLTSAERGQHVTVVCCIGSSGQCVPPALIFPRKTFNANLYDGAPLGTLKMYQDTGYMTGELFIEWMNHFIRNVKPSIEEKVLLLLDGHSSHKTVEALELAKKSGVVLLCLPPHCTHRLQPLDVGIFGPLDVYFNQEIEIWLKANTGRTVGLYQISNIFGRAYVKTVTMKNILSSFQACGLNPYNPDIFPDHLFAPSLITNNLNFEEPTNDTNILSEEQNEVIFPSTEDTDDNMNNVTVADIDTNFQTSSSLLSPMPSCLNTDTNLYTENISQIIQKISPLPSCSFTGPRKSNKNRSTGTQVLTKSPLIKQLKEKQNEKKAKELKKSMTIKSKNTHAVIKNPPIKNTKKKQEEKVIRKSKRPVNRKLFLDLPTENDHGVQSESDDDSDEEEVACLYCNDLYKHSKSNETWIRCNFCKKWAHTACANIGFGVKYFECDSYAKKTEF